MWAVGSLGDFEKAKNCCVFRSKQEALARGVLLLLRRERELVTYFEDSKSGISKWLLGTSKSHPTFSGSRLERVKVWSEDRRRRSGRDSMVGFDVMHEYLLLWWW